MANDRQRRRFKDELTAALEEVAGAGQKVSTDELRRLGVPQRWRSDLRRASGDVESAEDARDVARDYADEVFDELDRQEQQIADGTFIDRLPRL